MKSIVFFISLLISNAEGFTAVRPTKASRWVTNRSVLVAPPLQLSSQSDSSTAVLEREKTESAATLDATPSTPKTQEPQEELSETQQLMVQVKEAGTAGIISYALWELGFWAISVPVVLFGYVSVTGHFPDLSDKEDMAKLGAEAFAFVNFARFAVPLRIGLALSTTPWIQQNVVDRFFSKEEMKEEVDKNDT